MNEYFPDFTTLERKWAEFLRRKELKAGYPYKYIKNHPEKHKVRQRLWVEKNRDKTRAYVSRYDNSPAKKKRIDLDFLQDHHNQFKDDPEHLTTEFLADLLEVDCKIVARNPESILKLEEHKHE